MTDVSCLVTGGTGFVGRHVVQGLLERGCRATVLGRRPATPGDRVIVGDLSRDLIDLSSHRFDEIYHVAGLAHFEPRTDSDRRKFFDVNAEGTRNLLRSLETLAERPQTVVLVSTVAVYGVEEGFLLDEETPRAARDPYGASKRQAEDLLMEWGHREAIRIAIVRLPLVAGSGAPGNLGRMTHALARGRYLGIGAGSARRSMVLARDVAEVLPQIARLGGVFHLTDGHHPSFAELESALSHALGRRAPRRLPVSLAKWGARAGDMIHACTGMQLPFDTQRLRKMTCTLTFSDAKATRCLGWTPSPVVKHASELVA